MNTIDCLGDACPLPLVKLIQQMKNNSGIPVMIVTDHSCACEGVKAYCGKMRLSCLVNEPVSGVWEITVSSHPPKVNK